jgi:hypothetical protein
VKQSIAPRGKKKENRKQTNGELTNINIANENK